MVATGGSTVFACVARGTGVQMASAVLTIRLLVQSLNSPFFPPPIGAEPGRAKGESRITCMRMLRMIQLKITSPYHAARVNVSRNAFFSPRSEKKPHFLWR